ncbi:MAG: hypothetical protein MUW57_14390 [Pseudomonas sp.]|nr:hypothetical protein [Pseudomonas sp.]
MSANSMMATLSENSRRYEYELRKLQQELSSAHERELRLEQDISDALARIAGHQVKGGGQQSAEVKRLLDQRNQGEAQLRARLATAEAAVAQQLQAAMGVSEELQTRVAGIDRQLADDPAYQRQVQALREAETARVAASGSYEELRDECRTKLQGFQVDRLYTYLKGRKFGTEGYPRWTPWRQLDRWAARLCNFTENWRTEQTLVAIQQANESAASRLEKEEAAQQAKLTQLYQEASTGGDFILLQQRLQTALQAVEAAKAQANEVHASLDAYSSKRDEYLAQASALLAEQLAEMSDSKLERLAAQTAGKEDDVLARKVGELRAELDELRVGVPFLQGQCEEAQNEYERAKQLERSLLASEAGRVRQSASSRSNVDSLMVGLMKGALSAAQASNNRSSGSAGSSSSWGSSSSGSSSSSTRSRDSGGFSTSDSL